MRLKSIDELLEEINEKRYEILEEFAKAYLAETGLKPSEVELVEEIEGNKISWYFRKRRKNEAKINR